jgi:hypothetical protein
MKADMCILGGILFMWGVVPSFRFRDSRFTKKPDFGASKMEKALFVGRNKNRLPWRSSPSQGPHACYMALFRAMVRAKRIPFDIKFMQPQTW